MKLYMVHLQFSVYVHHEVLIYKEYYFLGYNAMYPIESQLMSRRNISPASSGSTLKMEAIYSSGTLVGFQQTTQCYRPEDSILHNH
jgi:hypothetical protein